MKIKATQKQIRQTPRKMRLVANEVKDLSLEQAMRQLAVIDRRASLSILKVVKQAIANAMNNHRLPFESLVLSSIQVTPGSTYKRWRAVSRGRAHSIMKRTSHVMVELEVEEEKKDQPKKVKEVKKETKKTAKKTKVSKPASKKVTTKAKKNK
jgi:large subunit ribosomal protein L22